MAAWDKRKMLSALDGIDDDLGLRAGKDALANPHGTVATKAPQEPGGRDATGHASGTAAPTLATDSTPHHSLGGDVVSQLRSEHHGDTPGVGSSSTANLTPRSSGLSGNEHNAGAQGTGNSSAQAMVSSYLAQGYSPQDHAAHLSEHWDLPVSHLIGKHFKRGQG